MVPTCGFESESGWVELETKDKQVWAKPGRLEFVSVYSLGLWVSVHEGEVPLSEPGTKQTSLSFRHS